MSSAEAPSPSFEVAVTSVHLSRGGMRSGEPRVRLPIAEMIALARRCHVRELSLFGSVLRPDFKEDSDIDRLVLLAS
ncbi:MAG: nucleotidyltransferase family protein [Egibacteraceae bacterium]